MRTNLFIHSTTKMAAAEAAATFSPPASIERSPWHSPVPYLFGGLAAMLGLIAFALLILACSYWKLSAAEESRDGDVDAEKGDAGAAEKALPVFEEKFLVIMAGEVKPTYLATPMSTKINVSSSFDDEKVENKGKFVVEEEEEEKVKKDGGNAQENGQESGDQSQFSQEQDLSNNSIS